MADWQFGSPYHGFLPRGPPDLIVPVGLKAATPNTRGRMPSTPGVCWPLLLPAQGHRSLGPITSRICPGRWSRLAPPRVASFSDPSGGRFLSLLTSRLGLASTVLLLSLTPSASSCCLCEPMPLTTGRPLDFLRHGAGQWVYRRPWPERIQSFSPSGKGKVKDQTRPYSPPPKQADVLRR